MYNLVYFDTNVYNHILDEPDDKILLLIKEAIDRNLIKVIASMLIWQEIALIARKDINRYRRMASLLKKITYSEIFAPSNEIWKKDFDAYLRHKAQASSIFVSTIDWHLLLDRITRGELDGIYSDKISEYDLFKKEHKSKIKSILRLSQGHPQTKEAKSLTLDEYIKKNLNNKNFIKKWLESNYPKETCNDLAEIVDLSKLPRERIAIKYCIVQMYNYFCELSKPKHGDNADLQHTLYAGAVNYFVTSDKDFLNDLKSTNEKDVNFMHEADFFEHLRLSFKFKL